VHYDAALVLTPEISKRNPPFDSIRLASSRLASEDPGPPPAPKGLAAAELLALDRAGLSSVISNDQTHGIKASSYGPMSWRKHIRRQLGRPSLNLRH